MSLTSTFNGKDDFPNDEKWTGVKYPHGKWY